MCLSSDLLSVQMTSRYGVSRLYPQDPRVYTIIHANATDVQNRCATLYRQTTVTACLKSKQLLLFDIARQGSHGKIQ